MNPSQGRGEGNDSIRGKPVGTLSSQLSLEKIEFAVGWFHIQTEVLYVEVGEIFVVFLHLYLQSKR